jgi:hypothetical protein
MDREGALPERCVLCNAQAGKRVARTLYWTPTAWRYLSWLVPLGVLIAGIALRVPWMALAFWPAVIVVGIAQYLVRKKLKLELGVCARHDRQRTVLAALSIAAIVGAIALGASQLIASRMGLIVLMAAILALAVLQRYIGVQAISLKRLDADHAWLGGTGKSFREALPELPGA